MRGLFARSKGGFYHDGRFASLLDVVEHYDSFFTLGLSGEQKRDLSASGVSLPSRIASKWGSASSATMGRKATGHANPCAWCAGVPARDLDYGSSTPARSLLAGPLITVPYRS